MRGVKELPLSGALIPARYAKNFCQDSGMYRTILPSSTDDHDLREAASVSPLIACPLSEGKSEPIPHSMPLQEEGCTCVIYKSRDSWALLPTDNLFSCQLVLNFAVHTTQ